MNLECACVLFSLQRRKIHLQVPPLSKKSHAAQQTALQCDHERLMELLSLYRGPLWGTIFSCDQVLTNTEGCLMWEGRMQRVSTILSV